MFGRTGGSGVQISATAIFHDNANPGSFSGWLFGLGGLFVVVLLCVVDFNGLENIGMINDFEQVE